MAVSSLLLAQFGKREHLESIMNGQLYFNPVQKYRHDGTDFRGDKNEGAIPIDPSGVSIRGKDGKDWFADLKLPRPTRIMEFIQGDESTFMFCCAMISKQILVPDDKGKNTFVLSEAFKTSVDRFGDHVLVFHSAEILNRLRAVQETYEPRFGNLSGPMTYRDFADFSDMGDYSRACSVNNSAYDRYFVKDLSYRNQNEWRLLIDGSEKPLAPNCGEGFSISIGKLDWAHFYETSVFLNTFQWTDECL